MIPKITALLRQSQCAFHVNELLEEREGERPFSTPWSALTGLAEGAGYHIS